MMVEDQVTAMTSLEVRERLVEALKLDLIGPWAGHALAEERLPGHIRPSNWYLAGFLIPAGSPPDESSDPDEDEDLEEVPAKSRACIDAGRPPIDKVKYDSQDEAANALILGRVDALSADSPVTAYVIERSEGRLEPAGEVFDAAPYGFVVAKGAPLGPVVQQAVQHLIDTGLYARIVDRWGLDEGSITTSQINAATS